MLINVTIRECKRDGRSWSSNHRADDENEAIEKAIKKVWGRAARFERDHGLSGNRHPSEGRLYGQVFRKIKNDVAWSSMTGRISIDTTR